MNDRRPIGWILGLIVIAIVATTTAVVLTWIASDLQIQVNQFYEGQQGELFDEDVYREVEILSVNSYTLLALVTPLLVGGMAAVFALLAVLAFRWERRPVATVQATAAS